MSEGLTFQDFAPHLHTRFRVAQFTDYEVELTELVDHSNSQLKQFSVVFTGTASPWLPQGSYALAHPSMQECEIFLVPLGPDATGMRYEAIFCRFIRAHDLVSISH